MSQTPLVTPNNMLQKTHVQTYQVILELIRAKGFPPTIEEIAAARKLSPTAAYKHVKKLVEEKMLKREPGKGRTLMPIK